MFGLKTITLPLVILYGFYITIVFSIPHETAFGKLIYIVILTRESGTKSSNICACLWRTPKHTCSLNRENHEGLYTMMDLERL